MSQRDASDRPPRAGEGDGEGDGQAVTPGQPQPGAPAGAQAPRAEPVDRVVAEHSQGPGRSLQAAAARATAAKQQASQALGSAAASLRQQAGTLPGGQPGPLVDEQGAVVGEHPGIAYLTIGQRSGLHWRRTTPERRYVAGIDPTTRTATVAPRPRLGTRAATLRDPIWHDTPADGVEARLRYQGPRVPVVVTGDTVCFPEPGPPLAVGQGVVLYDGPRVLGGGVAAAVERG